MWVSPFLRARETANGIMRHAGHWITKRVDSPLLVEQQFGLFEGIDWLSVEHIYPREVEYYRKASQRGGRFWIKMPLGESRFDVCNRVYQSFGIFHRDNEQKGVNDVIIVSHGVTIRAFLLMWLHLDPTWFDSEPNPLNCSVRLLYKNRDFGYIWKPEVKEERIWRDPTDLFLDPGISEEEKSYIARRRKIDEV